MKKLPNRMKIIIIHNLFISSFYLLKNLVINPCRVLSIMRIISTQGGQATPPREIQRFQWSWKVKTTFERLLDIMIVMRCSRNEQQLEDITDYCFLPSYGEDRSGSKKNGESSKFCEYLYLKFLI